MVDTFFVSRIGTESLAAVGLASVMFFAVMMLFRGTANSTVAFVGRAYGEQDDAKVGRAIWRSLNMIIWLSLPVLAMPALFTYLMQFAEHPEHPHVHFHIVPRHADMPLEYRSTKIFGYKAATEADSVSE